MKSYTFKIGGKRYDVAIGPAEGKTLAVNVNGADYTVELENAPETVPAAPVQPAPAAQAATPAPAAKPAPTAGETVTTPMPGVIIEICVREGQAVKAGQKVAVLEAMKMENEITASKAGTVAQIVVTKGQVVETGSPLVVIA
jgi:biotin carboxyl carrier protein